MKKSFYSICFLCLALILQGQDCFVCSGENVPLSSSINGSVGTVTYSWVCNNGYTSNVANPTVPITSQTTCTLNAIDQSGCQFSENVIIGVANDPVIAISESNCEISFSTQLFNGQSCTSYNLQRLDGSNWVNVSSTLPYTVDQDADYRVAYNCTCGTYYSNTISVTGCNPCSPFTINNDSGDCFIYILGSAPCGSSGYEVWANINASQTCSPDTPPCSESSMIQLGTTTSTLYTASSDGCYQWRCSSGGVDYCSNVICISSDCEVGCTGNIVFSTSPSNPPCSPFTNITWPCSSGQWYINDQSGNTVASGNGFAPTNYTFTYDDTYTFGITCSNNCTYTASYTVSGCGSAPCNPPSTLSIIENNCQLTASVANCGSPPLYSWSTGATTQTIQANTSGTYSVTVTNCCIDPLISSITVNCTSCNITADISGETNPCDGDTESYSVFIGSGSPPYNYQWTLDGVIVGTGSSYTYTAVTGTHSLSIQVTDSDNCVATDNHFINVDGCCCTGSTSLNYDSNNCQLTWMGCSGYTSQLQRNTGSGFVNIPGTSPYNITIDANYRVVFSKSGCTDITSNTAVTGCTAACDCAISFTYDDTNCQYVYSATGCDTWQLRKSNNSDCSGVTAILSGTGDVSGVYDICDGEGIGYYNYVATESGCPIEVSDCLESMCDCCTSTPIPCQSVLVEESGFNHYVTIGGQQNVFYVGGGFICTDVAIQNALLNYLNSLTCLNVTASFPLPDCEVEIYNFDQIIDELGNSSNGNLAIVPCCDTDNILTSTGCELSWGSCDNASSVLQFNNNGWIDVVSASPFSAYQDGQYRVKYIFGNGGVKYSNYVTITGCVECIYSFDLTSLLNPPNQEVSIGQMQGTPVCGTDEYSVIFSNLILWDDNDPDCSIGNFPAAYGLITPYQAAVDATIYIKQNINPLGKVVWNPPIWEVSGCAGCNDLQVSASYHLPSPDCQSLPIATTPPPIMISGEGDCCQP